MTLKKLHEFVCKVFLQNRLKLPTLYVLRIKDGTKVVEK